MRTLPGDTSECEIDMQDENQSILSISDDIASLYEENTSHTEEDRHQKNISSREEKVIRVLEMLKDERLSLIDLIEVIFSSRNASIRPFADKFFANVRLELALTIIVDRSITRCVDHSDGFFCAFSSTFWPVHSTSSSDIHIRSRVFA
jgi:hypothetical protein